MARLNEPPGGESLESLKRRFIRQNRDLAKNNSVQSVKIRALENEIGRLVAENMSLRETVLQRENELQHNQNRNLASAIVGMKGRLEAKMQEFNGLLNELGNLSTKPNRRKSQMPSPKRSPLQRARPRESGIAESLAAEEGRLPTIAEGKHFPRKTLESNDIQQLLSQQGSDSPDVGPPPMTTFNREHQTAGDDAAKTGDDFSSFSSVNLETRRRRRETFSRRLSSEDVSDDVSVSGASAKAPTSEGLASKPLRAGMKRKFPIKEGKDGLNADSSEKPQTGISSAPVLSPRKALAPKSVNTDPVVSPRKTTQIEPEKGKDIEGPFPIRPGRVNRDPAKPRSVVVDEHAGAEEVVKIVELPLDSSKVEPITPAPLDLFSPFSNEQSESTGDASKPKAFRADEPMPGGRVSRRARGNVSYAEPNLISKMRRPTSELADAVSRAGRQSSSAQPESQEKPKNDENEVQDKQPSRTVIIKKQESEEKEWKARSAITETKVTRPEPTSPLKDKETAAKATTPPDALANDLQQADSRQVSSSASSKAISTLMQGNKVQSEPERDALDVFDVKDTPPSTSSSASSQRTEINGKRSSSDARPASRGKDFAVPARPTIQRSTSLSRPQGRRQTLSIAETNATGVSDAQTRLQERRQLKAVQSGTALKAANDPGKVEVSDAIAERTARRRRSVMF